MPSSKKKSNKQTSTKKKSPQKKRKGPAFGGGVSWGSKQEVVQEDDSMPLNQKIGIAVIMFVLFMIALYVFVDDQPTISARERARAARASSGRSNASGSSGHAKEFEFKSAILINSSQLIHHIESESEDRLVVVTFDDSSQLEGSSQSATRVRSFRRMETLARSLSRKRAFKIYNEEELPLICLFDCGSRDDAQAEELCNRILGQSGAQGAEGQVGGSRVGTVIYHDKQGRHLPNEYRSDKQIVGYLHSLMQPAVTYLEERNEAEEFVAKSSTMNVLLFGKDSESYTKVADSLRDFAKFGRVSPNNVAVLESFAEVDDENLPQLGVWRTFGANPLMFPTESGNISDAQQLTAFVLNNYLPLCGEFGAKTQPKYMKRGLPVAFVVFDKSVESESLSMLVDEVKQMARSYLGAVSFATLDADEYPSLVENIGIRVSSRSSDSDGDEDQEEREERDESESDEDDDDSESGKDGSEKDVLPQVAIHVQTYSSHAHIDLSDIRQSIFQVVDPYVEQLRQQQAARRNQFERSQGQGQEGDSEEEQQMEFEDDETDMDVEEDAHNNEQDDDDDDELVDEQDVPAPKTEV